MKEHNNKMALKQKADNSMIILAAVLVLVAGVTAYLLSLYNNRQPTFEEAVTKVETQSQSTKTEDIEKDLEETDFSELDKEVVEIEAELEASAQE